MCEFRLKFHWSLFLRVQLTIFQHWFRQWLGAEQATSHYLNQWWPSSTTHICVTRPQWVNTHSNIGWSAFMKLFSTPYFESGRNANFFVIDGLTFSKWTLYLWLGARLRYSSSNALELPQSCIKPSIYSRVTHWSYRSLALSHLYILVQRTGVTAFLHWGIYIFSCNTLELPQSCTEPSIYSRVTHWSYRSLALNHLYILVVLPRHDAGLLPS